MNKVLLCSLSLAEVVRREAKCQLSHFFLVCLFPPPGKFPTTEFEELKVITASLSSTQGRHSLLETLSEDASVETWHAGVLRQSFV